jgi:16S rRNA (cytidine1402-2'-O)-methyltransferase
VIQNSYDGKPTLYIVPTPIGNMEDMTMRAIKILSEVDEIYAEDKREAIKILSHYKINNKINHSASFNENAKKDEISQKLKEGKNLALISDRGTPGISDPGSIIIKEVINKGFNVVCLPGATAFVPALVSSGVDINKFVFVGFLKTKKKDREKQLVEIMSENSPVVIYESPVRLKQTVEDLNSKTKNCSIVISREISKKHEQIYRGTSEDFLKMKDFVFKGEIVLIVNPKETDFLKMNEDEIILKINNYIKKGFTAKEAIKIMSKETGIKKQEIYKNYHKEV